MNKTELLYSESASRLLVSVKPELAMIFDAFGQWQLCSRVGVVTSDSRLTIKSGDSVIANEDVEDLARAFKVTLDWDYSFNCAIVKVPLVTAAALF